MEIDIAKLAAETAALLAPFLPYFIKGGKDAAQAAIEKTGEIFAEKSWEQAEKAYKKITGKTDSETEAALKKIAEKSDEKQRAERLEAQIKFSLEDFSQLAEELQPIINIRAGDGSVIINGDAEKNKIAVGEGAQVAETINNIRYEAPITDSISGKKENALRSYLLNLQKFCYLLPLAALGDDKDVNSEITLDHFYIQLDTTAFKEEPENAAKAKQKTEIERLARGEKQKPIGVMEAAQAENKLVLLGIAGSGKSTFVKKLIGLQASAILEKRPINGFALDLAPVYLELRKLSPRLAALDLNLPDLEKQRALSNAILEQIRQEAQSSSEAISHLEQAFYAGDLLLVLDGLDETPQELRQVVHQAVSALTKLWQVKRIIITSRFTEQTSFANFKEFSIASLTNEKIQDFVRGWYNEQVRIKRFTREEADKRTKDLAEKAIENIPDEMSSNPMTLTSIALIHTNGTELPRQRVELYSRLVNIFAGKWQETKAGSDAAYPENLRDFFQDKNRLRRTLEYLAYETHCANYRAQARDKNSISADLAYGDALEMLERAEYLGSPDCAKSFLNYMHEKAGLFTSKSGGDVRKTYYGFAHRAIQEYLAGCYMIAQEDPYDLYMEKAAQEDFWSRPALMGAEEIIYNQDKAWASLRSLLKELCPEHIRETETDERALLWAGQIAAEYGRENIEQKWKQGQGEEFLTRLIRHTVQLLENGKFLSPRERAEAGDTLAKLGDPRAGVIGDFVFCRIPKGKFLMGSKKDEKGSSDDERPQFEYTIAEDYFLSRYPITNAQFDLFVQAEGYKMEKYWDAAIKSGFWSKDGFKGRYDDEVRTAPISFNAPFNLPNHPVVGVSWYEAAAFCKWLNEDIQNYEIGILKEASMTANDLKSKIVNRKWEIRLPSEAEWERAARGGKSFRYPWGDEITPNHANYSDTNIGATSAVGAFPLGTNDYGLLDMSGNVWEWCATQWQDGYKDYLKKEKGLNSPEGDDLRVVRGGAFSYGDWLVRCAFRDGGYPSDRDWFIGFRVVVVLVSHFS